MAASGGAVPPSSIRSPDPVRSKNSIDALIELSARRVEIAGIVSEPDSAWMSQMSRNVTDARDGCLTGKRFLIHVGVHVAVRAPITAAGLD
jgi:hypothetical protein